MQHLKTTFFSKQLDAIRIALLTVCLLAGSYYATSQVPFQPRANYNARLEPNNKVLHGLGQGVGFGDVISWAKQYMDVMDVSTHPFYYMEYSSIGDVQNVLNTLNNKLPEIKANENFAIQLGIWLGDGPTVPGDAAVNNFAKALKDFGRPVYIRVGYEFNGPWNNYTNHENYKITFRKVYNALRVVGADNVATVWTADVGWTSADVMQWFPGAEYIDWFGMDIFSKESITGQFTIDYLELAKSYNKPVMIGEATPKNIGVNDGQADWDEWFRPFFDLIRSRPEIKAFGYISWYWPLFDQWKDWGDSRINTNALITENYVNELSSSAIYQHAQGEQTMRQTLRMSTPHVAITSPKPNQLFPVATNVIIEAIAKSASAITKVEFYNGTAKLGEDNTSPYTYTWNSPAIGTYTISAKVFDAAGSIGTSIEKTFQVAPNRNPDNVSNPTAGLKYEAYEIGYTQFLPNFNTITPVKTGTVSNIDLSPRTRDDQFAFRFTGYIDITTAGVYTFYLASDDGSKFYVGTQEVVNNDGGDTKIEKSGQIGLNAGKHAITVTYFDGNFDNWLNVSYTGPNISKQLIPGSALFYSGSTNGGGTPTNVALNKSAIASGSCNANELAAKAFDGNIYTKWCHNVAGTKWLQVDLGGTYNISRWVIRHAAVGGEASGKNTRDFKLQISTEGTSWTDVDAVTNNTANVTDRNVNTTGRYARLSISNSGEDNAARIPEFEIYGVLASPVNPVNVALNKPTTASGSCNSNEQSPKGVDGNIYSKWCHNVAGDKWLRVDLGSSHNISRWVVKHAAVGGEAASKNTRDFKLQISTDDTNWSDVDNVVNNTANVTDRNVSATGRYIRLYITNSGEDNAARIPEFEVHGVVTATATLMHSEEQADQSILYPNPATSELNVAMHGNILMESLIITDRMGVRQQNVSANPLPDGLLQVNVHSLKTGLYYLNIKTLDGRVVRHKFMIAR